jgi:hypothetical protein
MATSTPGPGGWPPAPQAQPPRPAWTAGRIVSVVIGSVLALISLGLLITGGILLWADQTQRTGGYLTVPSRSLTTSGYAVTSDVVTLAPGGADWVSNSLLGKIRIRVTPADPARPVFVGIARAGAVQSYLAGARYATVTGFPGNHGVTYTGHGGNVSPPAPLTRQIWAARASGTGTQTVTWQAQSGSWIFVVMNASGAPAVSVNADAGATVPILTGVAVGFLVAGAVVAAGAVALIVIPVRLAGRRRREPQITG